MTSTRTAEISTAFRTARPQFPGGMTGEPLSRTFVDLADPMMRDRFNDIFRINGVALTPEEYTELQIFEEFLARHVQQNAGCDVQCMLLWNEWVRTFRRMASGFPNLIRENEFRTVITGKYDAGIFSDGWRGAIYAGIRFVP